ncbi:MAG: hypothetical protein KY464_01365 [Gemmatimonadetes bacterium]|nr:hypothetical protein [Gemmatimonadota bacterium]
MGDEHSEGPVVDLERDVHPGARGEEAGLLGHRRVQDPVEEIRFVDLGGFDLHRPLLAQRDQRVQIDLAQRARSARRQHHPFLVGQAERHLQPLGQPVDELARRRGGRATDANPPRGCHLDEVAVGS